MSEDKTLYLPSFEEKVLTELNSVSSRLEALEKRVTDLGSEARPVWAALQKDLAGLNTEMKAAFGSFDRKLDVMNSELLRVKADQLGIESRIYKLESEGRTQVIVHDHDRDF